MHCRSPRIIAASNLRACSRLSIGLPSTIVLIKTTKMSKPNPVATIAMDSLQDGGADKLGTTMDQQNMDRLGKTQELRRNFKFLSVLGFTAVLMCTWEAILFTASYILPNGGLAGMVWMYVVCVVGFGFSILSMAEMASMAPTSGVSRSVVD